MANIPVPRLAFRRCIRVSKYLKKKKKGHPLVKLRVLIHPFIATRSRFSASGSAGLRVYSRGGVFHVAMLIRVVEVLFLVHLRAVQLAVDDDALAQAVHVDAAKLQRMLFQSIGV